MKGLVALIVLMTLFSVVFFYGCEQSGRDSNDIKKYEAVGVVRAISESKAHINIDHEAIEGFMDAMQMFFPVLDSAMLVEIEVADSVQFEIVVENGNYAISSIDVIQRSEQ